MEWDDARYVLAIHRAGSLSVAGRALGVNQSTVGRRLEALEAALGVRLFFRAREGYLVTPEGERLLPHAERMEEETQAILRELSGQEARLSGVVRVTAPDAMGARLVVPILGRFHARYPGIQLELVAEQPQPEPHQARGGRRDPRRSSVRPAARRPPHMRPRERAVRVEGLRRRAGDSTRGRVRGARSPRVPGPAREHGTDALDRGPRRQGPLRVPVEQHAGADRGERGRDGVALLACYLGDAERELLRVGTKGDVMMRSIWLVLHRDLQHAPRVRACADFLVEGLLAHAAIFSGKREKALRQAG